VDSRFQVQIDKNGSQSWMDGDKRSAVALVPLGATKCIEQTVSQVDTVTVN